MANGFEPRTRGELYHTWTAALDRSAVGTKPTYVLYSEFNNILTKYHGLYLLVFHVIISYFLGKINEMALAAVIKDKMLNNQWSKRSKRLKSQKVHKF